MKSRSCALIALIFSGQSLALTCLVLSVHDGDTLTARCGADKIKVRLTEIDAPERTQPYSRMSTDSLKHMCLDINADIHSIGIDRYGRTLGRVTCNGVDANAEQVRRGYAWAYDKYLTDTTIKNLETEARQAKRGLWQSHSPVPPWDFRHHKEK